MIGIIILNYIAWEETYKCIQSIISTCRSEFRIYLIDNASPNSPIQEIIELEKDERVCIIYNNRNLGYAAGNNIGVKKALEDNCKELLITNGDIIFHEGSIDNIIGFMEKNPEIGIVGPRVMELSGKVMNSVIMMKTGMKEKLFVRTILRKINHMQLYKRYYGINQDWSKPFQIFATSGCCLAISRACGEVVFPFDENTFLYEEELILGIKMSETRYSTFYYPEAIVTHEHAKSSKHIGALSMIYAVKSEIYYCKEYLGKSLVSIIPLYLIRTLSFLMRSINQVDYRRKIVEYFKITLRYLFEDSRR